MEQSTKINLGYCCISTLYSKVRCNRQSTKTHIENMSKSMRHDYLLEKAKENLEDLKVLMKLNVQNGIYAYRVPEQILPQVDLGYYFVQELKDELVEAGKVANENHIQLSTHPSQYYVLNSINRNVVNKSTQCLSLFADMFKEMELEKVPNITLHIGGRKSFETKKDALDAFCSGFIKLSETAKSYLVIENDHVSFDITDCLKLHELLEIPVVFDHSHYKWNPGDISYETAVSLAVKTWKKRVPKLHLSSDKEGTTHAHEDYVKLEDYLKLEHAILQTEINECNVMLECKEKDKAVIKLRKEIEDMKHGVSQET